MVVTWRAAKIAASSQSEDQVIDVQVAWVEVREIDVGLSQWRVNGREVSK